MTVTGSSQIGPRERSGLTAIRMLALAAVLHTGLPGLRSGGLALSSSLRT
jgi:hypothetical protein